MEQVKNMDYRYAKGFTLIEIVVTIIIVAIVGTMIVTLTSSNLKRSSESVFRTKNIFLQQKNMENITSTYISYLDETEMKSKFEDYLKNNVNNTGGLEVNISDFAEEGGIRKVTLSSDNVASSLVSLYAYPPE